MGMIDAIKRPTPAPSFDEVVERTRAELAALDFSEDNARLAALDDEIARCEAAIVEIDRHFAELREEEAMTANAVGRKLADQLLAGATASEAAASSDNQLAERKAALVEARAELRRKIHNAHSDKRIADHQPRRAIDQTLRPLLELRVAQALEAVEVLARCYADIDAMGRLGTGLSWQGFALRDAMKSLANSNFRPRLPIETSQEILSLKDALSRKGPVYADPFVRDSISAP